MMMIHLSQTPQNMSSIGAVCDSLGKTFLTLLLCNLGATGGLRVNSSPVKVKLIIFPSFPPEGNAILPLTAKAVCAGNWYNLQKAIEYKVKSVCREKCWRWKCPGQRTFHSLPSQLQWLPQDPLYCLTKSFFP